MKVLGVFAGQGCRDSQLFDIFRDNPDATSLLKKFSAAAQLDFLRPVLPIADARWTQLVIGVYQLTLFAMLKPHLSSSQLDMAGYSLGEISAFLASVDASIAECVKVFNYRMGLMNTLLPQNYDLLSISGEFIVDDIAEVCAAHRCHIAIINSAHHLILGGKIADLNDLLSTAEFAHLRHYKFLEIHVPSHTPCYADKKGQLQQFLDEHLLQATLHYPIINPLELRKIYTASEEKLLLDRELFTPLQWYSVCELISEYQYKLIIDLGPGDSMTTLLRAGNSDLDHLKIITAAHYTSLNGLINAVLAFIRNAER